MLIESWESWWVMMITTMVKKSVLMLASRASRATAPMAESRAAFRLLPWPLFSASAEFFPFPFWSWLWLQSFPWSWLWSSWWSWLCSLCWSARQNFFMSWPNEEMWSQIFKRAKIIHRAVLMTLGMCTNLCTCIHASEQGENLSIPKAILLFWRQSMSPESLHSFDSAQFKMERQMAWEKYPHV